jgi:glycosyltransferase involved in cell wall biosynthesis
MTRIAIVTARPATGDDLHARHARGLALGLSEAGLSVEHLAADHAVAPRLWESVRQRARAFDIVHVLGVRALPAVFAAHGRSRAVVVSPQSGPGPISALRRLLNMPSGRASRALLEMADRIVCSSLSESERMTQIVPRAGSRMRVVPLGVDTLSVRLAEPLPGAARTIVALSGPGRGHGLGKVIAALADLGHGFELVVVGPCAQTPQLSAEAAHLGVLDRVHFLGTVDDGTVHRWLRTACVVVALSERWTSPHLVLAALAAGTPIVVSEAAAHMDAVHDTHEAGVTVVPRDMSPLALADSLAGAARVRLSPASSHGVPTIADEIAGLLGVYGELVDLPADVAVTWSGAEARQAS